MDDVPRVRVPNGVLLAAIGPLDHLGTPRLVNTWDQATGRLVAPASSWNASSAEEASVTVVEVPGVQDKADCRAHWSQDFRAGRAVRGLTTPCVGGFIYTFSSGMVGYVGGSAQHYFMEEGGRGALQFCGDNYTSIDLETFVLGKAALDFPIPSGEPAADPPGEGRWVLSIQDAVDAKLMKTVGALLSMTMQDKIQWRKSKQAWFAHGYAQDLRALQQKLTTANVQNEVRWVDDPDVEAFMALPDGWASWVS